MLINVAPVKHFPQNLFKLIKKVNTLYKGRKLTQGGSEIYHWPMIFWHHIYAEPPCSSGVADLSLWKVQVCQDGACQRAHCTGRGGGVLGEAGPRSPQRRLCKS